MTTQELSVEELRARVKALDTPLEPAEIAPPVGDLPHELTHKEDKSPSMWRVLLQLRVLLPYLSRLVPLLDGTAHQSAAQSHELHQGLADVQSGHREVRTHLQEQTLQMKRVEEQLERLRETTERNTLEQQELIEDLKSFAGTVKTVAVLGVVLLLANTGLMVYLAVRLHR
jgi:ABC-type multidrug transport system fused ATPase/permease subunit